MSDRLTPEKQLDIISKAWGRQRGYAFFPKIAGDATNRRERIESYEEGPAFYWPKDKEAILQRMRDHQNDDLYWCPSLFERRRRVIEFAMDEHALWADLDQVDPHTIEDYPPTIAWESSPNRYQALWLVSSGDLQGASWQGGENHRLTYYLGADAGGWDTTQLLRIPGWLNHKPEHRGGTRDGPNAELSQPPRGKLLWRNGRRYLPDEFDDLPEVQTVSGVETVLEDEIEHVDRHEVWGRVRLKLPKKAREMFASKESSGDRSAQLWWLMRCLADVGCSVTEIVALVRETVWNKFDGRQDELKRLTIEASKAISERSDEVTEQLEEEREAKDDPTNLFELVKGIRAPQWLIKDVWNQGSCGFIAGQPKVFKSWIALDLALSVATGMDFLGHFPVMFPGPVLYVQEEDSLPMVKSRLDKVWPGKQSDQVRIEDGQPVWVPASEVNEVPKIEAYVNKGLTLSDPAWQAWLDEQLDAGVDDVPYAMVILDPLMMLAGEVEENRSQEMTTKIYKPLKDLSRKHEVAVALVHHMRKGDPSKPQRGGQLMLGSVANHAWSEDSMYLRLGRGGKVVVERESKHAVSGRFEIVGLRNRRWDPRVEADDRGDDPESVPDDPQADGSPRKGHRQRSRVPKDSKALKALNELSPGVHGTTEVAEQMGTTSNGAYKQLTRLVEAGLVEKKGPGKWELNGKS